MPVDRGNASRALDGGFSTGRPSGLSSIQRCMEDFFHGQMGHTYDVAPEGMRIEDGGGHSGNHEKMVTAPSAPADQGPGYLLAV